MSILESIKKRRSIRSYKPDQIPAGVIYKLIEALIWAPSAGSLQSRRFYFIFNEMVKKELAEAALNQDFIIPLPLGSGGLYR